MEANDTIISLDNFGDFGGISPYYLEVIKENMKAQDEVSFKAGKRKVVEWIKRSYIVPLTKQGGLIQVRELEADLQAKEKEWEL